MRTLTLIAILLLSFTAQADRSADFEEVLATIYETYVWTDVTDDSALKKVLEDSELKDPFSVRLKGIVTRKIASTGKIYWCGNIMAKNGFGAYGGWRRFYVSLIDAELTLLMTGKGEGSLGFVYEMVLNAACKDSPIFIPAE